jgi:hypothetical protein
MGDAAIIGVGLSTVGGTRVSVSVSGGGESAGVSIGSGVALARGFTVALGEGFAVGVAFGFAVGLGEGSSDVAGVLAWNGVEAASCARSNAAAASSTIARTNERM